MNLRIVFATLTLLTLPASALADAAGEMRQGIEACLYNGGDAVATHDYLAEQGWSGDADDEQGIGYVYPEGSDATVVTVALDGIWCNVESFTQSSEATAMQLLALIENDSNYDISYDKDDMGCTQFGLGDGWSATILSGGQDPICGADDNSAVRFQFPSE